MSITNFRTQCVVRWRLRGGGRDVAAQVDIDLVKGDDAAAFYEAVDARRRERDGLVLSDSVAVSTHWIPREMRREGLTGC